VAAVWSAMRRRTAVSVMPGRAAAACWRSNSATGRVMAGNTPLLRALASIPTATNRHNGSRQPGRGSTSTAPAATLASTAKAGMPARSGGVWVAVATAATYYYTQAFSPARSLLPPGRWRRGRRPNRLPGAASLAKPLP
jgi:hypothetical protein